MAASQTRGTIQGNISEEAGQRAVFGVLIELVGTELTTFSDENGEYKLTGIHVGNYRVKFSQAGFRNIVKTDVIVRPNRITFLDVEMREELSQLEEEVTVEDNYFHKDMEVPTGKIELSAEELRRTPGTAGLVSRVLTTLPGVSFLGADENTDLLVRGGSPNENGFFIDNVEVPNINHLPRLGSTAGGFTAVNPELIQNVDFYSGSFSPD